jgi:hypothetical protein
VKPFRYWRDGLFLLACSLYALNRWWIIPQTHNPFLRYHFNDLLLMPCALPLLLLGQRGLKLRTHDQMPCAGEIALYLTVWSILFEVIGPHLLRRATGDLWDVVAYVAGGLIAGVWWQRRAVFRRVFSARSADFRPLQETNVAPGGTIRTLRVAPS